VDCTAAPAPFLNLSGCDLSGVEWDEVDLTGADLSGANLIDVDLTGANLSDVVRQQGETDEASKPVLTPARSGFRPDVLGLEITLCVRCGPDDMTLRIRGETNCGGDIPP
jgi:hypothetical protein